MIRTFFSLGRTHSGTVQMVASAAVLLAVASVTQAQTFTTIYATGFDGTDTVNGTSTATIYNSPSTTPTDPLSKQNSWVSNDQTVQSGTGTTQLVGQSDFVGATGFFSGESGVLGGVYRTTAPTTTSPDVIPSTASGGVVNLSRPFAFLGTPTSYVFNVDFSITKPGANGFASHDTFGWSFANGTSSAFSINFTVPTTGNADTMSSTDTAMYTVGSTTTDTGSGINLNATYHLQVTVTTGTNANFVAVLSGASTSATFGSSLVGDAVNPASVNAIAATWNLADKTITNGGYSNAGDNYLIFDNYSVTATPEPSTYAMIALGVIGLAGVLRKRRQA